MPYGIYKRILFIIDADPDYSAEFALALAAITTFAASVTTTESGLSAKVATISWESIHQVTKELFKSHNNNLCEFTLGGPEHKPRKPVVITSMDEGPIECVSKSTAGIPGHLCLRFREAMFDTDDLDGRKTSPSPYGYWFRTSNIEGAYSSVPEELKYPEGKRRMFHLDANVRMAEGLPLWPSVSILTSSTIRRVIFDRHFHQLTSTFLWVSASEELQQFSWCRRVESHDCKVLCLSHFNWERERARERRMKIRNEHAEGFMAALTDLARFPSTIENLFHITRQKDRVFSYTRHRLFLQGLTTGGEGQLRLPPKSIPRRVFYSLLPVVNYDWRVAHFLSIRSSPFTTWLKAHLSPMLTVGSGIPELFHVERFDSGTKEAIQECLKGSRLMCGTSAWVGLSTLWAAKGLASMVDGRACDEDTVPLADGRIRVLKNPVAYWSKFYQLVIGVLQKHMVAVTDLAEVQVPGNEAEYKQISRDLLRAYSHQVTFSFPENLGSRELPTLRDFFTQRTFERNPNLAAIDWNYLFAREKEKPVVGVYTHLKRLRNGKTTVCNWTWIPSEVWEEGREKMEKIREERPIKEEDNSDEFWPDGFSTIRIPEAE